jgi:predicted ester cyclase
MLISGGVKRLGFPSKGEFTHPGFPDLHFDVETIFAEPTP